MPGLHELATVRERKVETALMEEVIEGQAVELVEVFPRPLAVVHRGEDRSVACPPSVGELALVAGSDHPLERRGNATAPVDERPKDIECERSHDHRLSLSPPPRAVCV